jgi:hypothetical protein
MLALGIPDASLMPGLRLGIFFVPVMVAATRELRRMVRPGGRFAITAA